MRGGGGHGFRICQERDHPVDPRLETQRLEDQREEAGAESGPVGGTGRTGLAAHVHWTWTKGHADHEDNNRADELATQAAREQL